MSSAVMFKQRIAILIGVLLLLNVVPAGSHGNIALGGAGRNHRSPHADFASAPREAPASVAAMTLLTPSLLQTQRYVAAAGTDTGDCSNSSIACLTISYTIAHSNPGDTINIGAGNYFESTTIDIGKDLTLQGSGATSTFVDGGGQHRVFFIFGATAQIMGLTIRNGRDETGAGILNGGMLTVRNSVISGNQAIGVGGVDSFGGGIHSYAGTLTLIDSTVSGNQATGDRAVGGGIGSSSALIVSNSTISGNTASGYGGGISSSTNATLSSSTITNNTAGFSGGGAEFTGTLELKNTILAGNHDNEGIPDCESITTAASQGYNLIGNNNGCIFTSASGDLLGTPINPIDPKLGPLENNVGATLTHAPLPGSPAVDTGSPSVPGGGGNACESTDQIGTSRPQGAACDIGAVEIFPTPVIDHLSPATATAGDAAFTLTIYGANFIHGSQVQWNGDNRPTTFVSDILLHADISAADVATQAAATVTVVNPAPGGGISNYAFAINNPIGNPTPTIRSLSPTFAHVGGPDFTLTISGTEFVNGVTVQWNGSSRVPTLVNNQELHLQISTSDIATKGIVSVTVVNPSPGGGASNTLTFNIENSFTRLPLLLRIPVPPAPPPLYCNDLELYNNNIDNIPLLTPFGAKCSGSFSFPPRDTLDLYRIEVDTRQTISIDLSNIPAQAEEQLKLWDKRLHDNARARALCVAKIPNQSSLHIVYPNAAPGTYYIGIFLLAPLNTPNTYPYVLRVSFDNNAQDCH
jgi:hypothetical protein